MNKNMIKSIALLAVAALGVSAMAQDNGGQGRRNRGGMAQRGGNQLGINLVFREDVQADLGLSDDQKSKLTALRGEFRGAGRRQGGGQNGAGGGGQVDRAAMQAQQAEQEKKINEILTADQQKRLKEIRVQLGGMQAVTMEAIQKELNLSKDQLDKIQSLQRTFREAQQSVREKVQNNELTREQAMESNTKNTEALKTEIEKVLTAEQKDKLKAMGGKPFKAAERGR